MQHTRRTKIIATLGPASNSEEMIGNLIDAGANFFRLNFSHGTHEAHLSSVQMIRKIAKMKNQFIGILADLQGPKIRVGEIDGGGINLKTGDTLTITTRPLLGNQKEVSTTYLNLPMDIKPGDKILLDDGLLTFQVKAIDINNGDVECEVIYGGKLKSKKGINLPNVDISAPSLTEQDRVNAIFAMELDVDYFALSFVRRSEDVKDLKDLLKKHGKDIPVIAKLERQEALDNFDAIIKIADGIMVARGDLGVEMPAEKVPMIQKQVIRKCNIAGKPVITATQMLESMIQHPKPTRAEVSDVANAILDGTDAIMLSGETAVGEYPIDAVKKMVDIAVEIELSSPILYSRRHGVNQYPEDDVEETIAMAACDIAKNLKVKTILSWTQCGCNIRLLSKFHPLSLIIALTESEKIARQVQLLWGVFPLMLPASFNKNKDWKSLCQSLIDKGLANSTDLM
ncbi:MAG: pyruvate kinase, partial [Spirochaetota bacterium]|nr:pyruvate kinase [Spirochaetota bacterium]